ncbi:MAG: N-acetylneuraminate synthase [Lachnospiraceae bacterium]|nr:N-acetylneuraminate synthase [Lachnospiraceae bacterium]
MKTLIIAEAGVNHNGDIDIAYRLCDAAKEAGADVIKFQTWKTENLITKSVAQAKYQSDNTGITESQFDMIKKLELTYDEFGKLKEYCDGIGIEFASTADEAESLDAVIKLGVRFLKVGSGEIGNIPYLRYIGSKKMPVILSTGMSTLGDVDLSVNALRQGGASDITLLHCTTNYPCPPEAVNLRAMCTLRDAFKCPVGYSDHTEGYEAAVMAVSMGASVLEKHFTLDRNMQGPDHKASADVMEFKQYVKAVRRAENMLGDGVKRPAGDEDEVSKVVRKRIVASRPIKKGSVITGDDIVTKRSDEGIGAAYWDIVRGSVSDKDYGTDQGISLNRPE